MRSSVWMCCLAACAVGKDDAKDTGLDTDTSVVPAIDLVTPLGADEARAGVLSDPAALVGGLGSESRPGDVLLINDRVRFVLQDPARKSGGLVSFGGSVLDADLVRHDGSAAMDLVFDWTPALGVGWVPDATSFEIVDDGIESGTAVVRVEAMDNGFAYLGAVLEDTDRLAPQGIHITTTYTLEAGSSLMRVDTTLTAGEEEVDSRPGDILQSFPGIASPWVIGVGRTATYGKAEDAVMMVHDELGLTLGMFAPKADVPATSEKGLDLFNYLLSFMSLYQTKFTLEPGGTTSWTRWWGVGKDPAQLTDAWLEVLELPTTEVQTRVLAGDEPVAGVRVTVEVDGAPWTLAVTDADGRVAAKVPEGSTVTFVADGSGSHLVDDLPAGAGTASPLGEASVRAAALATLSDGATATPHARGYGRASGGVGEDIQLVPPGIVRVHSDDVERFEVRARAVERPADDAYGLTLPRSNSAVGYARKGQIDLPLEPGTYDLTAWHGSRYEVHTEQVVVASGEVVDVELTDLVSSWSVPGWFLADTHIHAAPSFDGKLTPTDRALVATAVGLDIWFASEHDVAVDHAELVKALGLGDVLRSVTSVEVTPWVRGHINVFFNEADPDARGGGAWPWWEHLGNTTTGQMDRLLATQDGMLVQLNHPFSPGLPSFAQWKPGVIGAPDFWWDGFDAVEVIVPGMEPRGLDFYLDLTSRGLISAATGSTDTHDHLTNDPGLLATWMYVPDATTAGSITDAQLIEAIESRRTVATNGPFIELDPLPGSVLVGETTLTATAWSPSWMPVEELRLYKDGELEDTVVLGEDRVATWTLDPDADAVYVVEGVSETAMRPLGGRGAWAVTSAIMLDVDGNGWIAPKAPLLP